MSVKPENSGKIPGSAEADISFGKGIHPDEPIGPGNPPAANVFTSENNPRLGRPLGSKNAKTRITEMFEITRVIGNDPVLKKVVANFLKERTDIDNLDLLLVRQLDKSITKADTAAATLCLKVAGQLVEDGLVLPPVSGVKLDTITEQRLEAVMKKLLGDV